MESYWSTRHGIPNEYITRINDFATYSILDNHVNRTVKKLHGNTYALDPIQQNQTKRIIQNFRDAIDAIPTEQDSWSPFQIAIETAVDAIWDMGADKFGKDKTIHAELKKHLGRFLWAIHNDKYNIVPDDRYVKGQGVMVVAKSVLESGDEIKTLSMCNSDLLNVSDQEDLFLSGGYVYCFKCCDDMTHRTFATGPLMYVNHKCETFNCELMPDENTFFLRAVRKIEPGEELTIYYSRNYFGPGNIECKCSDCHEKIETDCACRHCREKFKKKARRTGRRERSRSSQRVRLF